jgi:hypothetical protein
LTASPGEPLPRQSPQIVLLGDSGHRALAGGKNDKPSARRRLGQD